MTQSIEQSAKDCAIKIQNHTNLNSVGLAKVSELILEVAKQSHANGMKEAAEIVVRKRNEFSPVGIAAAALIESQKAILAAAKEGAK
jgi:DNA-directed RNA polymerase specialized sigma54-like protein